MISLTDNAKAALVATTRLGDSKRPSLTARQWHELVAQLARDGLDPAAIFLDSDEIDPAVRELTQDAARVMFDLEEITKRGIWVLTEFDDDYPLRYQALGLAAPPVLFGIGDGALLQAGGVGVVGSREVDVEGADIAKELAAEAVKLGLPVVSGAARGVDQLAMGEAFRQGGSVVGVLADSLDKRIRSSDLLQALDAGTVCMITQQHPSAGFSPASAYGRNKLVYGLANLTVVVASAQDEGGTWKGAKEALSKNLPIAVWRGAGEGPGNGALVDAGANPITAVDQLKKLLTDVEDRPEQMSIL